MHSSIKSVSLIFIFILSQFRQVILWQVGPLVGVQPDMSCGCICHKVSLSFCSVAGIHFGIRRNFFWGSFMSVLLESQQVVHCTAVRSMKRGTLWGEGTEGGTQVHSLSATCTPNNLGNLPTKLTTNNTAYSKSRRCTRSWASFIHLPSSRHVNVMWVVILSHRTMRSAA